MRTAIILGAMICASPVVLLSATASATETRVSVNYCQPLTSANLEECCIDRNWQELIWPDQVRFCPPLSANDSDSGRLGEAVVDNASVDGIVPGTVEDPDTVVVTDPVITGTIDGNPGNQIEVGGAGEKGMDNEEPKVTGDKGSSNSP